jgi:dUTP pyrophosphatase
MDLCAWLERTVLLEPLERKLIPTGIYIALPQGYEAQLRPRSGLAFKRGLTLVNAPGTIDSDYRGEIMIALVNLSNETQEVNNGERIAQIVISKYETAEWIEVDHLSITKRGEGGFGHSGI